MLEASKKRSPEKAAIPGKSLLQFYGCTERSKILAPTMPYSLIIRG
jgi:hypothetical protein